MNQHPHYPQQQQQQYSPQQLQQLQLQQQQQNAMRLAQQQQQQRGAMPVPGSAGGGVPVAAAASPHTAVPVAVAPTTTVSSSGSDPQAWFQHKQQQLLVIAAQLNEYRQRYRDIEAAHQPPTTQSRGALAQIQHAAQQLQQQQLHIQQQVAQQRQLMAQHEAQQRQLQMQQQQQQQQMQQLHQMQHVLPTPQQHGIMPGPHSHGTPHQQHYHQPPQQQQQPASSSHQPQQQQAPAAAAAAAAPQQPQTQRFGPYIVGETIGRGSFGKVKVAVHETTGVRVALKVISRKSIEADARSQLKLQREIRVLRLLKHPHIMRLYDVVQTRLDIVLVLELVSGGELFVYLARRGRLEEAHARMFFQQFIAAIAHCHNAGVVHRDLKPENILVESSHRGVKIGDFGLSSLSYDGKVFETSCGTPNYAAPEVVGGRVYVGREADIWSAGVVLFTMVAGTLPFDDEQLSHLFRKIQTANYTMPSFLSPAAQDLISKILVVDPLERATTAQILNHPWVRESFPPYLALLHGEALAENAIFPSTFNNNNNNNSTNSICSNPNGGSPTSSGGRGRGGANGSPNASFSAEALAALAGGGGASPQSTDAKAKADGKAEEEEASPAAVAEGEKVVAGATSPADGAKEEQEAVGAAGPSSGAAKAEEGEDEAKTAAGTAAVAKEGSAAPEGPSPAAAADGDASQAVAPSPSAAPTTDAANGEPSKPSDEKTAADAKAEAEAEKGAGGTSSAAAADAPPAAGSAAAAPAEGAATAAVASPTAATAVDDAEEQSLAAASEALRRRDAYRNVIDASIVVSLAERFRTSSRKITDQLIANPAGRYALDTAVPRHTLIDKKVADSVVVTIPSADVVLRSEAHDVCISYAILLDKKRNAELNEYKKRSANWANQTPAATFSENSAMALPQHMNSGHVGGAGTAMQQPGDVLASAAAQTVEGHAALEAKRAAGVNLIEGSPEAKARMGAHHSLGTYRSTAGANGSSPMSGAGGRGGLLSASGPFGASSYHRDPLQSIPQSYGWGAASHFGGSSFMGSMPANPSNNTINNNGSSLLLNTNSSGGYSNSNSANTGLLLNSTGGGGGGGASNPQLLTPAGPGPQRTAHVFSMGAGGMSLQPGSLRGSPQAMGGYAAARPQQHNAANANGQGADAGGAVAGFAGFHATGPQQALPADQQQQQNVPTHPSSSSVFLPTAPITDESYCALYNTVMGLRVRRPPIRAIRKVAKRDGKGGAKDTRKKGAATPAIGAEAKAASAAGEDTDAASSAGGYGSNAGTPTTATSEGRDMTVAVGAAAPAAAEAAFIPISGGGAAAEPASALATPTVTTDGATAGGPSAVGYGDSANSHHVDPTSMGIATASANGDEGSFAGTLTLSGGGGAAGALGAGGSSALDSNTVITAITGVCGGGGGTSSTSNAAAHAGPPPHPSAEGSAVPPALGGCVRSPSLLATSAPRRMKSRLANLPAVSSNASSYAPSPSPLMGLSNANNLHHAGANHAHHHHSGGVSSPPGNASFGSGARPQVATTAGDNATNASLDNSLSQRPLLPPAGGGNATADSIDHAGDEDGEEDGAASPPLLPSIYHCGVLFRRAPSAQRVMGIVYDILASMGFLWKVTRPFQLACVATEPMPVKVFVRLFRAVEKQPVFAVDVRLSTHCVGAFGSVELCARLIDRLLAAALALAASPSPVPSSATAVGGVASASPAMTPPPPGASVGAPMTVAALPQQLQQHQQQSYQHQHQQQQQHQVLPAPQSAAASAPPTAAAHQQHQQNQQPYSHASPASAISPPGVNSTTGQFATPSPVVFAATPSATATSVASPSAAAPHAANPIPIPNPSAAVHAAAAGGAPPAGSNHLVAPHSAASDSSAAAAMGTSPNVAVTTAPATPSQNRLNAAI